MRCFVLASLVSYAHGMSLKAGKVSANMTQSPDCNQCAGADTEDKSLFERCNYWGDPHYTATWGANPRFDFQGLGVREVIINDQQCESFHVQAFHCQYKTSGNAVTIGLAISLNNGADTVYITKDKVETTGSGASFVQVPATGIPGSITSAQLSNGIVVATVDGCNKITVTGKTITGKPGFILSVKARAFIGVEQPAGVCGAERLASTFVEDSNRYLFTPTQFGELCTVCSSFGDQISPGCPGYAPPAPPGPITLTEECAWAGEGIQEANTLGTAGTSTPQFKENCDENSDVFTQDEDTNGDKIGFNSREGVCIFRYQNTAGGPSNEGSTCEEICQLIGTTCNDTPLPGIVDSGNSCTQAGSESSDCQQRYNSAICACDIPPNPNPGQTPEDLDPNDVQTALAACNVDFLLAGGAVYPPRVPAPDDTAAELDAILAGCITDHVLADPADKDDIVEMVQEQNPSLPPPCVAVDGATSTTSGCTCGGQAVCAPQQACLVDPNSSGGPVCLDTCASFTQACTSGTTKKPDTTPCNQGPCDESQCCEAVVPDPEPVTPCTESLPAAGDCACGGRTCTEGQFCESGSSTCLNSCATASTSICNGRGLLPNANTIPCSASGCAAGTCCSSPAPDVTCSTYDCTGLRWHADPAKASVTCKPSGCDHYTCCKFLRLRRRRRKGQYYNDNGEGYYAGSPELIATEESEDSAFMQHEAYWCEDDDDECEDEELGAAETEL